MSRNSGRQDSNRQDNNHRDNNRQDNNRSNFHGQSRSDSDNNDRHGNSGRQDNNRPDFNQRNSNGFGNDRRGDRRGGSRQDFSSVRNYHRNFHAERHFHAPYVRPRGFYVRQWTWGETLPPLFWGRQYWLLDFAAYDLPPPPIGAVWVRVGDDALLIDQDSGTIIEVDYGVFY